MTWTGVGPSSKSRCCACSIGSTGTRPRKAGAILQRITILGIAFFEQFLDHTMMYSSGYFQDATQSMGAASEQKMDLICQKLKLCASDHLLEIGTGWGGFACFAARKYGCRVTTTTISEAQFQEARARVAAAAS